MVNLALKSCAPNWIKRSTGVVNSSPSCRCTDIATSRPNCELGLCPRATMTMPNGDKAASHRHVRRRDLVIRPSLLSTEHGQFCPHSNNSSFTLGSQLLEVMCRRQLCSFRGNLQRHAERSINFRHNDITPQPRRSSPAQIQCKKLTLDRLETEEPRRHSQ